MAEFKCKYCGNSLHPEEGQTLIRCNRCDETTRIAIVDNEKKYRLMQEADELRFGCLFDRAMQRYESIIQEFSRDANAYWGYVLCIYGVEFQDDVRMGKRLPTLHRISTRSILEDPYYKKALEYANPVDAADYDRIAGQLEYIRKRFIELSQKEENKYDIFISFKQTDDNTHKETIDCSKAENLYYKLQEMGYKVFFSKISLANRGGDDYEPIIYTALDTSKVMLVIGSSGENLEAPWVRNEWNRFLDMMQERSEKRLLPIYFGDMTPEKLPESLRGLQGYNIDTPIGVDRVLSRIKQLIPNKKENENIGNKRDREAVVSSSSLLKRARLEAEAQNWEGAANYYNRVLESDPECAEAWIGYLLSTEDEKFVDLYQYGEYLVYSALHVKEENTAIYTEDNAFGKDGIEKYVVENYLSEEEIIKLLPENLSFLSIAKPMAKRYTEILEWFNTNKYYNYAVKYAKGEYAEKLEQFQRKVLDTIGEAVKKVEDDDLKKTETLQNKYSSQMKEAGEIIQTRYQEAIKKREEDYQNGISAKTGKDVPMAIQYLKKVGNYLDAQPKLHAFMKVEEISIAVGNGDMYLLECLAEEKPFLLKKYQNAMSALPVQNFGTLGKWMALGTRGIEKWVTLAIYLFFILVFLLSGNAGAIGCTILGIIGGVFFWKKNKPYISFISLAVFHLLAGAILSPDWILIMAVLYIFSFVRKKGFIRNLLSKKREMSKINEIGKEINEYEKKIRDSINKIWREALNIEYDGVKLKSIMKILEKNPYVIQPDLSTPSTKYIEDDEVVNNSDIRTTIFEVNQTEIQQNENSFNLNEFEKIFNDIWEKTNKK